MSQEHGEGCQRLCKSGHGPCETHHRQSDHSCTKEHGGHLGEQTLPKAERGERERERERRETIERSQSCYSSCIIINDAPKAKKKMPG